MGLTFAGVLAEHIGAGKAHQGFATQRLPIFQHNYEIPRISGDHLLGIGSRTVPPGMMMTASR